MPARGDLADHVLDRLGRGWIEARGWLIEQEDLRFLGERACERKPLLLAAGELARRPAFQPAKTDERAELEGVGRAPRARHTGGGERIASPEKPMHKAQGRPGKCCGGGGYLSTGNPPPKIDEAVFVGYRLNSGC